MVTNLLAVRADQILNGAEEAVDRTEDVRRQFARPAGPGENVRGTIEVAGIDCSIVRSIQHAERDGIQILPYVDDPADHRQQLIGNLLVVLHFVFSLSLGCALSRLRFAFFRLRAIA
jgi:hypothetical protein